MKYFAHITDDVLLEQLRAKIRPLVPQAEEIAVTIAEQMRQEGLVKGRVETILKQLTLKFGALTDAQKATVTHATSEELDQTIERVMTEDTLEAVLRAK